MRDKDESDQAVRPIVERIKALIAKAESSPYEAEADAFMAKAQQLIEQHAINQALLHGADPSSIGHDRIPLTGSYSGERSLIWGVVARANRCEVLNHSQYRSNKVTELSLVGRAHDRELVRIVASSLELQATRRMLDIDTARGRESAVVQRRSFLRGFAVEVADRFERARRQEHVTSPSAREAAQTLALASDAVDTYLGEHFDIAPSRRRSSRLDGAAFSHGRRAGASADVGAGRLGDRGGRALPSG